MAGSNVRQVAARKADEKREDAEKVGFRWCLKTEVCGCFHTKLQRRHLLIGQCVWLLTLIDRVHKQSAKGASAGAAAVAAATDAKSISMDELKDLLKANNLDHTGLKQELIQRVDSFNLTDQLSNPIAARNFLAAAGLLTAPVCTDKVCAEALVLAHCCVCRMNQMSPIFPLRRPCGKSLRRQKRWVTNPALTVS